jgi:ribosomal protein L34
LNFSSLIYFLLQFGKSSCQQELDCFFEGTETTYTKGALTQHRAKLNPEVFSHLNKLQTDYYYSNATEIQKWKGHRLVSIDGSTIQLPYSNELIENFGHFETRTENGRKVVMARLSQAYDPLNEISIDAQIGHYRTSEVELFQRHLDSLAEDDLIIADRGYSAYWLMALLLEQKKNFLIRVKANKWKQAKHFLNSSKDQEVVKVSPCNEAIRRCKERGIEPKELTLRFVRVPIANGEDHVLITNLTDKQKYSRKEVMNLYLKRWPVEESFKLIKVRAQLENMSGKTTNAVCQDFFRIIMRANLSNILSRKLTSKGRKTISSKRKRNYQLNRTQAYRKIKNIILGFFNPHKWRTLLYEFAIQLLKQLEIVRENRSNPRSKRYSGKPAGFSAYKP